MHKPFWIWDQEEHLRLAEETDGNCCFNHIVGLPIKDKKEYPHLDYEEILYGSLLSGDKSFKYKHLWVLKSTGLGITEFFLRVLGWLCTKDDLFKGAQACIVTGPNIDIAIKLIKRLKAIFEGKLGLINKAPDILSFPLFLTGPFVAQFLTDKGVLESSDQISFGQSNYGYKYSLNISSPSKFLNSFSGLPQIGSFLTAIPEGYNVPYKGMLILTEKQDGLYAIVFLSPKENFDSVLNEIKPTLDSIQLSNSTE